MRMFGNFFSGDLFYSAGQSDSNLMWSSCPVWQQLSYRTRLDRFSHITPTLQTHRHTYTHVHTQPIRQVYRSFLLSGRNVRWPRRMLSSGEPRWVCRRDRQTDRWTRDRYITLSAIIAGSVIIHPDVGRLKSTVIVEVRHVCHFRVLTVDLEPSLSFERASSCRGVPSVDRLPPRPGHSGQHGDREFGSSQCSRLVMRREDLDETSHYHSIEQLLRQSIVMLEHTGTKQY